MMGGLQGVSDITGPSRSELAFFDSQSVTDSPHDIPAEIREAHANLHRYLKEMLGDQTAGSFLGGSIQQGQFRVTSHIGVLLPEKPSAPQVVWRDTSTSGRREVVERTEAEAGDQGMLLIQAAASLDSPEEFVRAVRRVDLVSLSPGQLRETIQLALKLECTRIAREVAEAGYQLYSGDSALRRMAQVLAPAKVIRRPVSSNPGLAASMEWYEQHAHQYRGHWIAVLDGELVAHSSSYKELREILEDLGIQSEVGVARVL